MNINKKIITLPVIGITAFFLGLSGGLSANTQVVEKVVEKPVNHDTQEETKRWHELKKIDDFIFTIAGETMGTCSQSVDAASSGDWDKLEDQTKIVKSNSDIIKGQTTKRNELLNELGYKENGN